MDNKEQNSKIQEARDKLKEKYANVRLGGPGSQRRKHKSTHKSAMSDHKLEGVMKKFNTQPIPDIAEVNMFTKDNKVISFQRPQGKLDLTSTRFVPDPDHDRQRQSSYKG